MYDLVAREFAGLSNDSARLYVEHVHVIVVAPCMDMNPVVTGVFSPRIFINVPLKSIASVAIIIFLFLRFVRSLLLEGESRQVYHGVRMPSTLIFTFTVSSCVLGKPSCGLYKHLPFTAATRFC